MAVAALLLAAMSPGRARADGSDAPPEAGDRVIKIGPQAVVIVDERGDARMYDDPHEQARACKSRGACWGGALGILSGFFVMTYEQLTTSTDQGSRALQRAETGGAP